MKVLVQRYMDDGYGNTHLIEEGTFDKTLYENIQKAESDSEIYDALLEIVPETNIDLYSIGNPNGYGNVVDEYRILEEINNSEKKDKTSVCIEKIKPFLKLDLSEYIKYFPIFSKVTYVNVVE